MEDYMRVAAREATTDDFKLAMISALEFCSPDANDWFPLFEQIFMSLIS
jgi:hypothetical protein